MTTMTSQDGTSTTPPPALSRCSRIALILPGAIAFGLGVIEVTTRSIWIDESATISIASQHGKALASAIARDGGNMAGYYALIHVIVSIFGNGLLALRLPSVIASGVTATLVALLALRLFSYRAALVAGLFSAVSLPAVFWAQDARSYALLAMFVTASYLALLHYLDSPQHTSASRLAVASYVITITAALYMSFVAAFIVLAQLILCVTRRRDRLQALVGADLGVVVLALPLVAIAVHRGAGQLFWVPRPNWTSVEQVASALTSAGFQPNFALTAVGSAVLLITLALLALGLCVSLVAQQGQQTLLSGPRAAALGSDLCATWILVPLVFAFAESFISAPSFTDRDLLIALPGVALTLGAICTSDRLRPAIGYGILAALLVLRTVVLVPTYGKSPENWSQATKYLVTASAQGACIAFYPLDTRMAIAYYLKTEHHGAQGEFRSVLPTTPLSQNVPYLERYETLSAKALQTVTSTCASLWLVSSHEGTKSGTSSSRANYRGFVELRRDLEHAYPSKRTTSFGWAARITLEYFQR